MNRCKKCVEITGMLMLPIEIGTSAFISEKEGLRRTSTVLSLENISQTEIRFETLNTNYLLHVSAMPEFALQGVTR